MELHKRLLLLGGSVLLLTACGTKEREIDKTDVNTFIEDLSENFGIEEEPDVYVSDFKEETTYDFGNFSVDVNKDRELMDMYMFFSNKEETEDLIKFLGLKKPKDFDSLASGESIAVYGDYIYLNIDKAGENDIDERRKEAEEKGIYFDERNNYTSHVLFKNLEN